MEALIPLALLVVVFYLLILRPARNRQKQAQQVNAKLNPGVEVMTTAGLFGRVRSVDGDHVTLEIADGVTVKHVKAAIAQIVDANGDGEAETSERTGTGHTGEDPGPNKTL